MTAMEALQKAIDLLKGPNAFASAIGVSDSAPHMWKKRGRVPAEYCPSIEKATAGQVRCEDLRPDVAWDVLRMQSAPTEATAEAAQA